MCNVLEASATTFCAASSQLFGDSESISITFTIFGMSLISLPLQFRTTLEIWPQALLGSQVGRVPVHEWQESLGADPPSPSYGMAGEAVPSNYWLKGHARRVPNFRRLPSISSKSGLRCRGYLQNRFLQFLHINRFGEMSGKAGAAATLHVLLHPITTDGDAFGIADL